MASPRNPAPFGMPPGARLRAGRNAQRNKVYNRWRSRSPKNGKGRTNTRELEKQICSRSTHGSGDDGGDLSVAPRRPDAGRLTRAVSHDSRNMGDFRAALREAEITRRLDVRLKSRTSCVLDIPCLAHLMHCGFGILRRARRLPAEKLALRGKKRRSG